MSTQNPNPSNKEDSNFTEKAKDKINDLESKFVSLSSQRQLNFVIGALILLGVLLGPAGLLILLGLGTLMIVQAATGNMILNNAIDNLAKKLKK